MTLRAIDLYAGIGGWSLGLELAGIKVVKSYEWWSAAAETHKQNLGGSVEKVDIRSLLLDDLPKGIDFVVGSPPCTQFSYSNRGGSGDVSDGLKDIKKFLEIVAFLKPKYWVFENVPRVANVLRALRNEKNKVLGSAGRLLDDAWIDVVDASQFGLPQARKRCLVGNFDLNLLTSYQSKTSVETLGSVLRAVEKGVDPNFSERRPAKLTETDIEVALSKEETRFNYEMKQHHPIYNGMAFPDDTNKPSRTVTAVCTRVSRESIVVECSPGSEEYRRLSVRERACLQGFPIEFQFHGVSHAEKLKMIGNAIPPVLTYYIGNALQGISALDVKVHTLVDSSNAIRPSMSPSTQPDLVGRSYPEKRRFRFAVPNLRFKSGTRFELTNGKEGSDWSVDFYCGDSKRISRHMFDEQRILSAVKGVTPEVADQFKLLIDSARTKLPQFDDLEVQLAWSHRGTGPHPFDLIDCVGSLAAAALEAETVAGLDDPVAEELVSRLVFNGSDVARIGEKKLRRYAKPIIAGACLQAAFNSRDCKLGQSEAA
ncbi:DNA (cytosine-5-)-methyltransferase [Ruegeria sp. HKCCSP351]|uniref:DNA cytosine methyltransferase n=1 Tax=Ruegeria sp. HKCCSP351 TaxID=2794832 RepID=UPI001AE41836